jgi:hypothetical protein
MIRSDEEIRQDVRGVISRIKNMRHTSSDIYRIRFFVVFDTEKLAHEFSKRRSVAADRYAVEKNETISKWDVEIDKMMYISEDQLMSGIKNVMRACENSGGYLDGWEVKLER